MTTRTPAPAHHDLGEIIAFSAVARALGSARREVIRAKACWANWAQRATRAIEEADGPAARDVAWLQLQRPPRPVIVAHGLSVGPVRCGGPDPVVGDGEGRRAHVGVAESAHEDQRPEIRR